jgi:RNA polymerase sigma-70 factor (ECF subfamily)
MTAGGTGAAGPSIAVDASKGDGQLRAQMARKASRFTLIYNTSGAGPVTPVEGCHKTQPAGVVGGVARELAVPMTADDAASGAAVDLDSLFRAQFPRIARLIARVTRDPSRAEELAVDVFLKWSRTPKAHGPHAIGWLYRTAIRIGLNELRAETRRGWYERMFAFLPNERSAVPTPEDTHGTNESREHVRIVLSELPRRQAAMLLLRSDGLSYAEIAAAVNVNAASVGTLLVRAQRAFRKEYIKRYGTT